MEYHEHKTTDAGRTLEQLIEKAIEDLEHSASGSNEITTQAHADGHTNHDEGRLLHELNPLIVDGIIMRNRG